MKKNKKKAETIQAGSDSQPPDVPSPIEGVGSGLEDAGSDAGAKGRDQGQDPAAAPPAEDPPIAVDSVTPQVETATVEIKVTQESDSGEAKRRSRKERRGRVVSAAMNKSVIVRVDRLVKHPVYGKYIRRSTRLMAHDEKNDCREGDAVRISECRPLSKNKCWRLVEIVERAK